MKNYDCYYELLQIEVGAGEDVIKKAYKKMALRFHPDKNPGNEEASMKFIEIGEAYEKLTKMLRGEESDDELQEEFDEKEAELEKLIRELARERKRQKRREEQERWEEEFKQEQTRKRLQREREEREEDFRLKEQQLQRERAERVRRDEQLRKRTASMLSGLRRSHTSYNMTTGGSDPFTSNTKTYSSYTAYNSDVTSPASGYSYSANLASKWSSAAPEKEEEGRKSGGSGGSESPPETPKKPFESFELRKEKPEKETPGQSTRSPSPARRESPPKRPTFLAGTHSSGTPADGSTGTTSVETSSAAGSPSFSDSYSHRSTFRAATSGPFSESNTGGATEGASTSHSYGGGTTSTETTYTSGTSSHSFGDTYNLGRMPFRGTASGSGTPTHSFGEGYTGGGAPGSGFTPRSFSNDTSSSGGGRYDFSSFSSHLSGGEPRSYTQSPDHLSPHYYGTGGISRSTEDLSGRKSESPELHRRFEQEQRERKIARNCERIRNIRSEIERLGEERVQLELDNQLLRDKSHTERMEGGTRGFGGGGGGRSSFYSNDSSYGSLPRSWTRRYTTADIGEYRTSPPDRDEAVI